MVWFFLTLVFILLRVAAQLVSYGIQNTRGCSSQFKIAQNNAAKHLLYAVIWGLGFQALGF